MTQHSIITPSLARKDLEIYILFVLYFKVKPFLQGDLFYPDALPQCFTGGIFCWVLGGVGAGHEGRDEGHSRLFGSRE